MQITPPEPNPPRFSATSPVHVVPVATSASPFTHSSLFLSQTGRPCASRVTRPHAPAAASPPPPASAAASLPVPVKIEEPGPSLVPPSATATRGPGRRSLSGLAGRVLRPSLYASSFLASGQRAGHLSCEVCASSGEFPIPQVRLQVYLVLLIQYWWILITLNCPQRCFRPVIIISHTHSTLFLTADYISHMCFATSTL